MSDLELSPDGLVLSETKVSQPCRDIYRHSPERARFDVALIARCFKTAIHSR
jgi:hypothetical protein